MTQIKVPPEIKREIGAFAGITGRTQSELVAEAWREYRARHSSEFRRGLEWAEGILDDPAETAVAASGLNRDQLEEIDEAFAGEITPEPAAAPTELASPGPASKQRSKG